MRANAARVENAELCRLDLTQMRAVLPRFSNHLAYGQQEFANAEYLYASIKTAAMRFILLRRPYFFK
jgi:hypothetical protein